MADERSGINVGDITGHGNVVGHESSSNVNIGSPDWPSALTELNQAIATLPSAERRTAQAAANELEDEVAKPQPDRTKVQQSLDTLRQWSGVVGEAVVKATATEAIKQIMT